LLVLDNELDGRKQKVSCELVEQLRSTRRLEALAVAYLDDKILAVVGELVKLSAHGVEFGVLGSLQTYRKEYQ
jgi:hypothetical protein